MQDCNLATDSVSVCLSHIGIECVKTKEPRITWSSLIASPWTLQFLDINFHTIGRMHSWPSLWRSTSGKSRRHPPCHLCLDIEQWFSSVLFLAMTHAWGRFCFKYMLAIDKFVAIGCRPDAADAEYDLLVPAKSLVTVITQSCEQCHDTLVTIKCHLTSNINNN